MEPIEAKSTTYSFSQKFKMSIYSSMLIFLGLSLLTIYIGIVARTEANPNAPLVIALALVFLTCSYYCFDILPRIQSKIIIDEDQIIQQFQNGQTVLIKWRDVVRIRGRQFLGRIEIFSRENGKVIHVEAQIEGFTEIVTILQQKVRLKA